MAGPPARSWQVLLRGGAAGTGKSAVSYRLAQHFGVGNAEIDDFQVLLERLTTPEQQPVLHFWRTQPEAEQLPAPATVEQIRAVGRMLAPGLEALIANHLETETPVILEGDFVLPALAAQTSFVGQPNAGRVRSPFLYELDEQQLCANFLRREPERGLQQRRARVSRLYGHWLKQKAGRHGLPASPARPWPTVLERSIAAIG